MPEANTELAGLIRDEIQAAGAISFARFMELALYHPVHGYYQQPPLKQIGCQGDFYTSVSVGPLFGRLLAFEFAGWLDALGAPTHSPSAATTVPPSDRADGLAAAGRLHLVEAGAHDGRLALDILTWFREHRPDQFGRLEYWILENSPTRQKIQSDALSQFTGHVHWFPTWEEYPTSRVRGVCFANEFLDAFPVFRLGWDARQKRWFEWRVDWNGNAFVWVRATGVPSPELAQELQLPFWAELPRELLGLLPDGYTVDLAPAVRAWWSQAASRLQAGSLLTIDYGLDTLNLLSPYRVQGTLRSYRAHELTPDPLSAPGGQDLTAHIDFAVLEQAGRAQGLQTAFQGSQSAFLTSIATEVHRDVNRFGPWSIAENRQFQTLTHPQHLGRPFRVLRQAR